MGKTIDGFFSPIVKLGAKIGITANHISYLQLPFVALMIYFLSQQNLTYAAIALLLSLFLDILDGTWARVTKTMSKKGHKIDKALDLIGIYAFLLGVAVGYPHWILIIAALAIVNALLYTSDQFIGPELYCGVRSFGVLGLLFSQLYLFIQISLGLGVVMLLFKSYKLISAKTGK